MDEIKKPGKKKRERLRPLTYEPDKIAIGRRVTALRKGRDKAEIERLSGVTDSSIKRSEEGAQVAHISLIAYYCLAEGANAHEILFGVPKEGDPVSRILIIAAELPEETRIQLARLLLTPLTPGEDSPSSV